MPILNKEIFYILMIDKLISIVHNSFRHSKELYIDYSTIQSKRLHIAYQSYMHLT